MCAESRQPVFIDLETRSECDLKVEGGWRYAVAPSTRLLTVAWSVDGEYHCWFPGLDRIPADMQQAQLPGVTVHLKSSGYPPPALIAVMDRPWVAHNAWTFDRTVWNARVSVGPKQWLDTYPLALAAGLPGGLNAIGHMLWGEGKYAAGSQELKKASRCTADVCEPENVDVGPQLLVARYNVQDVKLLVDLWPVLMREVRLPESEQRILAAHDACNSRGVRVDRPLLTELIALTAKASADAVSKIAALTGGELSSPKDLRSRKTMFSWLTKMGVNVGSSLRKDIIARFIDEHKSEADSERAEETTDQDDGRVPTNLFTVINVLQLRSSALRITEGKLNAATQVVDADDRVRGWAVYWGAHTGRWTARRIQPHNLPRPKDGVDTWAVRRLFQDTQSLDYSAVKATLATGPLFKHLTVDDVSSAMIRSIFIPSEGKVLGAADLSNIEARRLAWLARERWLMTAFREFGDPYIAMAERIFGPKEKWPPLAPTPKKHPYRQVGKVVELGSGYQLGIAQFALYAAANGLDLEAVGTTPKDCIIAYRRAHPAIAGSEVGEYNGTPYFRGGYWDQVNDAALVAVGEGRSVSVGDAEFRRERGCLIIVLPSGRRLVYRNATVEMRDFFGKPRPAVYYVSARFGRTALYGGKITENIVQADSRDGQAHGFTNCEAAGLPVVLHCHDELVAEMEDTEERFDTFMRCITTPPSWWPDFPLDAEGSTMSCYSKSPEPPKKDILYRNGAKV